MKIGKHEIIRLRPKTRIEFDNRGKYVMYGDITITKDATVLKVLEVFSTWKTIEKGIEELGKLCSDKYSFLKTSADFYDLLQKEFFEVKSAQNTVFGFHEGNFDSFPVHLRMLNDRARTESFQKAIRETIRPDDIVLDIGSGSGVLAITAAMAGAKHVYAIEKSSFSDVTEAIFKQNGIEDKITMLKGHSTEIELPQKATVLVSEIIGNDPFDEDIIRTFNDAKARLLCEGARIIPQSITVFAIAAECNQDVYNDNNISAANFENWQKWYGIDFSPFNKFHQKEDIQKINIKSKKASFWKPLSSPVELNHTDLTVRDVAVQRSENIFTADHDGILNGIVLFFETALTPLITLSLHPEKASASNHWTSQMFFTSPERISKGEMFKIHYEVRDLKSDVRIEKISDK